MRFKWIAWFLIAIQTVMLLIGSYIRAMDLLLLEFVSKTEIIGYLFGSVLWFCSLVVVLLLAAVNVYDSYES